MEVKKMISVIVPIYNVSEYLPKCIESIINSTYKNLEIILVDDGSTDASSVICDDYAKMDSRIKVIHKKNGGLSDARNKGIDIANGEYISFVDSDDYIDDNLYEYTIKEFDENIDIIVFGRYIEYETKTDISVPQKNYITTGKNALIDLANFKGFDMAVWDKIYKKSIIGNLRFPFGKQNEDYYLTYKLLDNAENVKFIQKPFYHYVQRQNSISRGKNICFDAVDGSIEEVNYIRQKYPDLIEVALTNQFFAYVCIYNVAIKQKIKVTSEQRKIIKSNSWNLLNSVLKNTYLSFSKKIQALLFTLSLPLYKIIFIIKINIKNR